MHCLGVGNTHPTQCLRGTFNVLSGQSICQYCPLGMVRSLAPSLLQPKFNVHIVRSVLIQPDYHCNVHQVMCVTSCVVLPHLVHAPHAITAMRVGTISSFHHMLISALRYNARNNVNAEYIGNITTTNTMSSWILLCGRSGNINITISEFFNTTTLSRR